VLVNPELEFRLVIDYGGRDGIRGLERRNLGAISEERARTQMAEMLRDHARRVELQQREVGEWVFVEVRP
jgi:hypothetical protein